MTVGLDPSRSTVEPWVDALRGELLLRTGRREEGCAVLKEVVRALRAAPGPDAWSQGLFRLELLAKTARERATGIWPSSLRRRCSTTTVSTAEPTSRSASFSAKKVTRWAPRGNGGPHEVLAQCHPDLSERKQIAVESRSTADSRQR